MKRVPGSDPPALPLGPGVRVLAAAPGGLVALDKPAGVLAHPNRAVDRPRSLLTASFDATDEVYTWPGAADEPPQRAWLLHRLDSATSGVILLALDPAVAAAGRAAFATRGVTKRYLAVVLGHPRERRAEWRDRLAVERAGGVARTRTGAGGGGQAAATGMRVLRLVAGPPALAVLELSPHTGRTHQLRVQCARRGFPILGDQTYGNFRQNRELARRFGSARLFLHAAAIALDLAVAGRRVHFRAEAPLPPEFDRFGPRP